MWQRFFQFIHGGNGCFCTPSAGIHALTIHTKTRGIFTFHHFPRGTGPDESGTFGWMFCVDDFVCNPGRIFLKFTPQLVPRFVAVCSWCLLFLGRVPGMLPPGRVLAVWRGVIVSFMKFVNCFLPFCRDRIRSFLSLVFIQTWFPPRQPSLSVGRAHFPLRIKNSRVRLLKLPRLERHGQRIF